MAWRFRMDADKDRGPREMVLVLAEDIVRDRPDVVDECFKVCLRSPEVARARIEDDTHHIRITLANDLTGAGDLKDLGRAIAQTIAKD
jgi:hypothetical protein